MKMITSLEPTILEILWRKWSRCLLRDVDGHHRGMSGWSSSQHDLPGIDGQLADPVALIFRFYRSPTKRVSVIQNRLHSHQLNDASTASLTPVK